jgi:hypothetical protein
MAPGICVATNLFLASIPGQRARREHVDGLRAASQRAMGRTLTPCSRNRCPAKQRSGLHGPGSMVARQLPTHCRIVMDYETEA